MERAGKAGITNRAASQASAAPAQKEGTDIDKSGGRQRSLCSRIALLSLLVLCLMLWQTAFNTERTPDPIPTEGFFKHPLWLKSCRHIYLDMGSNSGVQMRKLFQPELYLEGEFSKLVPLFEKHYGPPAGRKENLNQSGLCALGFEPNPRHHPRLDRLERAYYDRGWHVHFYPFAAWSHETVMKFFRTPEGCAGYFMKLCDEGARISTAGTATHSEFTNVRCVDIAAFLQSLPPHSLHLWKMDIEGAEWEVMSHLLKNKLVNQDHINEIVTEVHGHGNTSHWPHAMTFDAIREQVQLVGKTEASIINELDDESYRHDVDNDFSGTSWRAPFEKLFQSVSGNKIRY